jgi:two-component system response regulator FixJ
MTSRFVVHLVDDDAGVRRALGGLLAVNGYTVQQYATGGAFLAQATPDPGCILLDLRMPDMSGLEVQEELDRRGLDLPIVYLTAHGDVQTGILTMKRGAVDFLEKPVEEAALLQALEEAFRRLAAQAGVRSAARLARSRSQTLTTREREVIDLVVQGRHNPEIARILSISTHTVKVHRLRGMAKMDVTTVPDLTRAWAAAQSPDISAD